MVRSFLPCLLLLGFCPSVPCGDAKKTVRAGTEADSVLAVYSDSSRGPLKLVFAVWGDGHLVWSSDKLDGGPPYHRAQIDAKRVAALIARMDKDGLFADKKLARANVGPDAHCTTIWVKSGKRRLEMQSWHEFYEDNGRVVATASGLETLQGRSRLEVLRKEPADYLFYRMVWGELRGHAAGLIPDEGKPTDGHLVMKAAVVSWEEGSGSGLSKQTLPWAAPSG